MSQSKILLLAGTILSAALAATPAAAQPSASPYTSGQRFDAMHRVTGTISPDPDGVGPLPFRAVRNSYDSAGRLTRVETGTLSAWQSEAVAPSAWSGFTVHQVTDTLYDARDRKVRDTVSSGGTAYAVFQHSWDPLGRPLCTAIRVNPATFAAPPASACTLGTEGTFGPDRITRSVHDVAGQRLQLRVGVGTAVEAADATWAYDLDGRITTVIDGNGNRAALGYDGHGRQARWTFPSASGPSAYNDSSPASALATAGSANPSDYEEYGYDPNGNRTSRRVRSGETIAFTFDALNRETFKDLPGAEPDVTTAYDLLGRRTGASQPGHALAFGYDGFGRLASESGPQGVVSSHYDGEGRRTRVDYPGGYFLTYSHLDTGEVTHIREYGGAALATFGYDGLGRRTSLARGNGVVTAYAYDPVSRLASLSHDLPGAGDVTFAYAYNPASQIAARTSSNDAYAFVQSGNPVLGQAHDGLNRITFDAGVPVSHDARGNLTSGPAVVNGTPSVLTFGYDSENRLTAASGGRYGATTMSYDPLGRLYGEANWLNPPHLYDSAGGVQGSILERDPNGNVVNRMVFGPGTDEPLVSDFLGTRMFYLADERGSIIATTNTAGNLASWDGVSPAITAYDNYGTPRGGADMRYQYTGQLWLPAIAHGIYHYKNRAYHAWLARFLQTDPIGYEGGVNLYAYVGNNPINAIDPSGTDAIVLVRSNNRIEIILPMSFSGNAATPENIARAIRNIESRWSGTFGRYTVTTTVIRGSSSYDSLVSNSMEIVTGPTSNVRPDGYVGHSYVTDNIRGSVTMMDVAGIGIPQSTRRISVGSKGEDTFGHEGGHYLGVGDRATEGSLMGPGSSSLVTEGDIAEIIGFTPQNNGSNTVIQCEESDEC